MSPQREKGVVALFQKKKIKDVNYLAQSMRVHVLETRLLSRDRIERMLAASTNEEAAKVLAECGYPELTELTATALEKVLTEQQQEVLADLGGAVPDETLVDVFKVRHDYHNAKVLVKAEALGVDEDRLLVWGGRYDPEKLAEDYKREELNDCSDTFRQGVSRAREALAATGDPQQADFALDRAYFEELTAMAGATGSKFLVGYAALLIDVANLRAVVRVSRLNKGTDFLNQVLVPGGSVSLQSLATVRGDGLAGLFRAGGLAEAAEEGAAKSAPGSGPLTEFERLCDDAVMNYLSGARMVPFGPETIVGYLYAREAEATAIRTIMSGRMAGLDSETIRQRLRRTYA